MHPTWSTTRALASAKAQQKLPQGTPRETLNLVNNEGAGLREGTAKASARHPAGNPQPCQQRGRWPPRRHRKSFRKAPRGKPSTLSTTRALASAKAPQKPPQGTPREHSRRTSEAPPRTSGPKSFKMVPNRTIWLMVLAPLPESEFRMVWRPSQRALSQAKA